MRNQRGGGIVEGAAGLMLVIGASVAGALLVLNLSMVAYYQGKLGLITEQAALFAATHHHYPTVQAQTTDFVTSMLTHAGVPANSVSVTVTPVSISDYNADVVNVSCWLPLFGNINFMPHLVRLSDQEVRVLLEEPIAYSWWPTEQVTNAHAIEVPVTFASWVGHSPVQSFAMLKSIGNINGSALLQHGQEYWNLQEIPSAGAAPGPPLGPPPYAFEETTYSAAQSTSATYAGQMVIP